jgi:hypothetical protein
MTIRNLKKNFIILALLVLNWISLGYAEDEEDIQTSDEEIEQVFDVLSRDKDFKPSEFGIENNEALSTFNSARIIALNKITAKSQEMTLKIGKPKYFGNVQVTVHQCVYNQDVYNPDYQMFITVTETKIDDDPVTIFEGWMFSSSISISTVQHPVYEIFSKECF